MWAQREYNRVYDLGLYILHSSYYEFPCYMDKIKIIKTS